MPRDTIPVPTTSAHALEDTESSSYEEEEMTMQEHQELNETLVSLGTAPIVVNATPISVVFTQDIADEGDPIVPILIPSDNEESSACQPISDPPAANAIETEEVLPQGSEQTSLQEIDLSSAMVLYSGMVNLRVIVVICPSKLACVHLIFIHVHFRTCYEWRLKLWQMKAFAKKTMN